MLKIGLRCVLVCAMLLVIAVSNLAQDSESKNAID